MKKKLLLIFIVLVTFGLACMWLAPRVRLDLAARNFDPSKMELSRIDSMHKSHKALPNGIETGLLHLGDGTYVKYWFISKHIQPGRGTTRFESVDGKTIYFSGYYCCEVSLPKFENWNELQNHITKRDGSSP